MNWSRLASVLLTLLLASSAGCGGATSPGMSTSSATPLAIVGADVSSLAAVEHAGGVFSDALGTADALTILKRNGVTHVRLRLFHAPDTTTERVNSLAYDLALARRARQQGLQVILDIHYSDDWADPGHQATPAAWIALGEQSLRDSVFAYTRDVVAAFRAAGATPDIIQLGNEVNGGMLWPSGHADKLDSEWAKFAALLTAGRDGARAALAGVSSVRFMHHVADARTVTWHMDHLLPHLDWKPDLIGVSYYPFWHGDMTQFRASIGEIANRYAVPIVVAETAYPWTNQSFDRAPDAWHGTPEAWMPPFTPQGQATFLAQLESAIRATPGGLGAGVVYWEPAWLPSARFGSPVDNLTLFDATGRALPGLAQLGATRP